MKRIILAITLIVTTFGSSVVAASETWKNHPLQSMGSNCKGGFLIFIVLAVSALLAASIACFRKAMSQKQWNEQSQSPSVFIYGDEIYLGGIFALLALVMAGSAIHILF